jgi:nitric oxide reductase large subunit
MRSTVNSVGKLPVIAAYLAGCQTSHAHSMMATVQGYVLLLLLLLLLLL